MSHHSLDEHYFDVMHGFIFETGIAYGNIISGMSDESLNVEVSFVVTIYREVGNAHESM